MSGHPIYISLRPFMEEDMPPKAALSYENFGKYLRGLDLSIEKVLYDTHYRAVRDEYDIRLETIELKEREKRIADFLVLSFRFSNMETRMSLEMEGGITEDEKRRIIHLHNILQDIDHTEDDCDADSFYTDYAARLARIAEQCFEVAGIIMKRLGIFQD